MIELEEANQRILDALGSTGTETLALSDAATRVLAADISSPLTCPLLTTRRWMAMRCGQRMRLPDPVFE